MEGWTLHGTIWTEKERPQGRGRSWTWAELLEWFDTPATLAPGDGPEPDDPDERKAWKDARKAPLAGWSPTHFTGDYRKGSNVEAVGALLLDLDSEPGAELPKRGEPALDPERLHTAMSTALPPGTAWTAHTSPSSRPDAWRWRAVVPLSEPVDADTHRALTAWLRLHLAKGGAPAMAESDPGPSMDPARLWFVPARDDDNPDAYATGEGDGDPLHVPAVVSALLADHKGAPIDAIAAELVADCETMRADRWPPPGALTAPWRTLDEWRGDGPSWLDLDITPPLHRWLLMEPDDTDDEEGPGLLPRGKVGMLVAAGSAGKTMALCELALCVATGRPWFGHFPVKTPGRVLLALGEEDAEEAHRRLHAAAGMLNLGPALIPDAEARIVLLPLAAHPNMALTQEDSGGEVETRAARELLDRLKADGEGWALIILDPASRFAGPDMEKDNAAATRFVQVLEKLAAVEGSPSVLVAHHTPQAARGGGKADATHARGVTAFSDAVRWQAELGGKPQYGDDAPKLVDFTVTKNNYSPAWPSVLLARDDKHHGMLRQATQEEREAWEAAHEAAERAKQREAFIRAAAKKAAGTKTGKPREAAEAAAKGFDAIEEAVKAAGEAASGGGSGRGQTEEFPL